MPKKSHTFAIISPSWLVLWSVLLALSWLLPVNVPPWATFPADAWFALLLAMIGGGVIFRIHSTAHWHGVAIVAAMLVFLPWLQLYAGVIPFLGQAWIASTYLLGFLLALLIGARWAASNRDQLAHGLFIAVGLAAVLSVGLQLYVWLGLWESGVLGIWALAPTSSRLSANLGQPNQLATLLLWGLGACAWAYFYRLLRWGGAIGVAAFLLLGLSLTQSRTGFLALTAALLATWMWRKLWPSRWFPWAVSGLYAYFLACPFALRWLNGILLLEQDDMYARLQQTRELRLSAWQLFLQAIVERPWLGYGWTELSPAQLQVADRFPSLGGIFTHSHNLFLDLVLSSGLPIGLLVSGVLVRWFWLRAAAIRQHEDAILLMVLGMLGIHALLEYPLQYAYFLLPSGLIMGVLDARLQARVVLTTQRWILGGLWLTAVLMFGVTIRDYMRVDTSYSLLRLEQSLVGQGRAPMGDAPDVWVLTHLRDWIALMRFKVHPGMDDHEIEALESMTTAYPSLSFAYRLATALALNNREDEARTWLGRICKFTNEKECMLAQQSWARDSANDPRIAAIAWPHQTASEKK